MPMILEISVEIQMERSVSVSSDRIIGIGIHPLPKLAKLGNLEKVQKVARAIPTGWPSLIGKCHSIFLGYSH